MTESEYAVLNYDDQTIKDFASELKCKIVWVSLKEKVKGAYRYNGDVFFDDEYVLSEKDVNVFGEHNVFNMLFAISVCKILGLSNDVILSGLKKFKCMKHRLEIIKEIDGVKYFNDSKATNTASTITAIENMKSPTVLILGGSEKGENYDLLFKKIKEGFIKHVVITGASRFNMLDSASRQGVSELTMTENFDVAVRISRAFAEKGDNVLLSPACASFDLFKSYEERGDVFRNIVESFVE
jgi:UDP-N-acetylmuramoylalanine--D-glutamate ligase